MSFKKIYICVLAIPLIFKAPAVWACSMCFKDPSTSVTSGIKLAAFTLLGALFIVFGAFLKFIWGFQKRSQTMSQP